MIVLMVAWLTGQPGEVLPLSATWPMIPIVVTRIPAAWLMWPPCIYVAFVVVFAMVAMMTDLGSRRPHGPIFMRAPGYAF